MKPTRLLFLTVIFVVAAPTFSHASEFVRTHPDLSSKIGTIHNVVMLPPNVSMYELGAGGTLEKMEDWGTVARTNVTQALETRENAFRLTRLNELSMESSVRDNYEETRLLYDVVGGAIIIHTYDYHRPWHFPEKARDFVYSLGSDIQRISPQADAYLLIHGFDHRTTGGRKALQAGTMLIGAVLGVVAIPRSGDNLMTVALVEAKTGTILWFYRTTYAYDLREVSSAATFVEDVMKELPALVK